MSKARMCYPDCDDPFCERVHPIERDEIPEGLIEEIAGWVWNDPDDIEARKEDAKIVITRIARAIADGEMKLPGELVRTMLPLHGGTAGEAWKEFKKFVDERTIVIAFRKGEEG